MKEFILEEEVERDHSVCVSCSFINDLQVLYEDNANHRLSHNMSVCVCVCVGACLMINEVNYLLPIGGAQ